MAIDLLLRSVKGSPLTHNEVDGNFTSIQTAINDLLPIVSSKISLYSADTPPADPSAKPLWFDSVNLRLKYYYNDGDSSQWVDVMPAGLKGDTGGQSLYEEMQDLKILYSIDSSRTAITTNAGLFEGVNCTGSVILSGTGAGVMPFNTSNDKGPCVALYTGTTTTGLSALKLTKTVYGGDSFEFFARLGIKTFTSDMAIAVGLSNSSALNTTTPSSSSSSVLLVKDSTDTNWYISTKGPSGSQTKLDTGLAVSATEFLDFYIKFNYGDGYITVDLRDRFTNTVYVNNVQISDTLPSTFGTPHAHVRASSGSTSKYLTLNKFYLYA